MNIEQAIVELTAALKENTATLREVLSASGSNVIPMTPPATAEEPAPKKRRSKDKAPAEETTPAAYDPSLAEVLAMADKPAAEDVTTTEPAADTSGWDHARYVKEITEFVKKRLTSEDNKRGEIKEKFCKIREAFNVEKAAQVAIEDMPEFWEAIQEL